MVIERTAGPELGTYHPSPSPMGCNPLASWVKNKTPENQVQLLLRPNPPCLVLPYPLGYLLHQTIDRNPPVNRQCNPAWKKRPICPQMSGPRDGNPFPEVRR